MRVRITQLDGKLPNLALMRISAYHKKRGDEVHFTFSPRQTLFEPDTYDRVYGSCIFKFNLERVAVLKSFWPDAIVGGSGVEDYSIVQIGKKVADQVLVEDVLGDPAEESDYSLYPNFTASIGFTQRGCRLKCGFCGVPGKEGENRSVASPYNVWRGPGYPKKLHLLDNDFFGQPNWEKCVEEIGPGANFLQFRSGPRKGQRMSLAELPPGRGNMKGEPSFSCSFYCDIATKELGGN